MPEIEEEKDKKPPETKKTDWLKSRLIPILSLCFIVAIIIGVFYFYREYPDKVDALQEYGYLGAFLISILLNFKELFFFDVAVVEPDVSGGSGSQATGEDAPRCTS